MKAKVCANYPRRCSVHLNGYWCGVETCLSDAPYVHFTLSRHERTRVRWFRGKQNNVGMCLEIYWLISFKQGVITDFLEFYSLIPVGMTLILFWGHSCMRNQSLLLSFSHICFLSLQWNLYAVATSRFVHAHSKFIVHNQYSKVFVR